MLLLAIAAIIVLAAVITVLRDLSHLVETHQTETILAFVGLAVLCLVLWIVMLRMSRHTVVSYRELQPARTPRQLPRPVSQQAVAAAPAMATGTVISHDALAPEAAPCDRPGCDGLLDDPWELDVMVGEGDQAVRSVKSFCSQECAESWQHADEQRRESAARL